jgi:hypothetical protein
MRTETRNIYTAAELKKSKRKALKGAFEKAFAEYLDGQHENLDFESDDLMGALNGLFEACNGVKMTDWSLGMDNHDNHITVEFTGGQRYEDGDDVAELSGPRALAWLENNLLSGIRIPFVSLKEARAAQAERAELYRKKREAKTEKEKAENPGPGPRFKKSIISRLYGKPGTIADCPFSGMCYDNDFLDALIKDVKDGDDLKSAFQNLDGVYVRLLESANDYQRTEAYFLDHADANGWEYDGDGNRI